MRFGSICSGIEAASVAWHDHDWEAAWLAEVDVAASAVLAHRLGATAPVFPLDPDQPGLPTKEQKSRLAAIKAARKIEWGDRLTNWGDFTRIPELIRQGKAEAPDVLCGGTPCQSYSIAGRREGLEDSRGQLTLKFVELADAIDEQRARRGEPPCVVFWENVPGVLSSKDNAFGCFLADLAGEDLPLEPPGKRWENSGVVLGPKRAIAWTVKDAQYFGLAQRRARVFVVASAREGFDPASVLFEFDGVRRDSAPSRETWQDVAGTLASRADGCGERHFQPCEVHREDGRGRDAASGRGRTERPAGVITMAHGQGGAEISFDRCPTLTCNHEAPIAAYDESLLCFSCKDYGGDATFELAPTMRAMNRSASHANAGGQLAVVVHGTQDPCTSENLAFALGRNNGGENAVCVSGDVTHTLTAEGFDASEDGTGRGQPIVACNFQASQSGVRLSETAGTIDANYGPRRHNGVLEGDMAVRRLMPVECERLQGFDDDWTLVPVGKKLAADGPRYKQLGNSWAVPCVRWIGGRIDQHLAELDGRIVEAHPVEVDAMILWLIAP
ncbi:DNA cytosine methyltransferase [Plastorhodobacter daqingensis]|uniref:DNA (cytosine-5-)-methyltransferase n=1 Tax=Plastorhodobacter daqingensis TaxID=1387281 RepID=A0ABW2UKX0_9RHOB